MLVAQTIFPAERDDVKISLSPALAWPQRINQWASLFETWLGPNAELAGEVPRLTHWGQKEPICRGDYSGLGNQAEAGEESSASVPTLPQRQ